MLDAVQSTPTSVRSCASGHYSAFSAKSCLMLSNPPPLQSGLVHLAITVPFCQVMLDAVESTPTSIRSCASAITVPFCQVMLDAVQSTPLQSGIVRLAIVPSLSSHAWCCPIHPRFNQVLCIWPLQCLLCQVMLDAVQSTSASIRSCASGHYSAFSVKSCLMMSKPPPHQSGIVHLAITAPSLSSHAWWCPIHPRINQVLCIWPLQCLLCQVMLDDVQSTPTSIRYCASGHYSAFLSSHAWWYPIHPPLQSGLVHLAITVPSLSSHAWWCPIHPHINQVLCVWPLQCLLCQVMLDAVQSTPASIRYCASGHCSAFSVKSCLMLSNPPHFNQVLCVWPL